MKLSDLSAQQHKHIKFILLTRSEPIPETGCWIWMASRSKTGYGDFRAFGKNYFAAHRASYHVFNGPIDSGLHVLHRCDVRECINPSHLFVGTNADNIRDAVSKGKKSKVSPLQVIEIRKRRLAGDTLMALAKEYGVTQSAIGHLTTNRNWSWLTA